MRKVEVQITISYGSGRFCSSKCARGFSTQSKREEINEKVSRTLEKTSRVCIVCGNDARASAGGTGRKCVEHKSKPVNEQTWEELKRPRTRKRRLLEERGHCCERCGMKEWMGEAIPIQLDHVDGNSDNDSKDNLRLICPNCHAQTPNYCGKNKGKGQTRRNSYRREHYKRVVGAGYTGEPPKLSING